MIVHMLMFKLKNQAGGKTKKENALELKKRIEALKPVIKEIIRIEVGINSGGSTRVWDAALYSEFESFEALAVYRDHPEHMKVVDFVNMACEDRITVDYERN